MKEVHLWRVDEYGFKVEPLVVKFDERDNPINLSEGTILVPCPNSLYRAKWNGVKWVEDMSQEEIEALYKQPIKEPTEIEILKQEKEILAKSVYDLTTIVELILTGGIA